MVDCTSCTIFIVNNNNNRIIIVHTDTGTTSMTSYIGLFKACSIPKAAKEYITEKYVDFVCRDIRPELKTGMPLYWP